MIEIKNLRQCFTLKLESYFKAKNIAALKLLFIIFSRYLSCPSFYTFILLSYPVPFSLSPSLGTLSLLFVSTSVCLSITFAVFLSSFLISQPSTSLLCQVSFSFFFSLSLSTLPFFFSISSLLLLTFLYTSLQYFLLPWSLSPAF